MCYNTRDRRNHGNAAGKHGKSVMILNGNRPLRSPGHRSGLIAVLFLAMVLTVFPGCGDDDPVRPVPAHPRWTQVLAPEYTHRAVWGVSSTHFFVASEKGSISRFQNGKR